jgi:hypothetical protein
MGVTALNSTALEKVLHVRIKHPMAKSLFRPIDTLATAQHPSHPFRQHQMGIQSDFALAFPFSVMYRQFNGKIIRFLSAS